MTMMPETGAGKRAERARKSYVIVYSDYLCSFCLLTEHVLPEAIGDRHTSIEWRACELRLEPVLTLRVENDYQPTIWSDAVYPRADRLGVPIQLLAISPQTRTTQASERLVMAQDKSLEHPYPLRVLRPFFQEGRDIGDAETLIALVPKRALMRRRPVRHSKAAPMRHAPSRSTAPCS